MFSTWNISSTVDDTRVNVIIIFTCIITAIIGDITMISNVHSDSDWAWWTFAILTVWSSGMATSVFIPKIVKATQKSDTVVPTYSRRNSKSSISKKIVPVPTVVINEQDQ